jgi:TatD DNase family protein
MGLIDTHCHLSYEGLENISHVIEEARRNSVSGIINCGTNISSSEEAVEIASQHKEVWAAVGIHPEELTQTGTKIPLLMEKLSILAGKEKVVAIGECGLDRKSLGDENRDELLSLQKELFRSHAELACQLDMPIIIHNRETNADILDALSPFYGKIKGVMHCFSQDVLFLRKILDYGFYISFSGNITFKNSHALRELVKDVPKERILVETDAPFLTPEPLRGKWPNTPANVKITAEYLSDLLEQKFEDFARQTTDNAKSLFGIY